MATWSSTFPFFTSPDAFPFVPFAFPAPIPTQIDPNWPLPAATPIHGDLRPPLALNPVCGYSPVPATCSPLPPLPQISTSTRSYPANPPHPSSLPSPTFLTTASNMQPVPVPHLEGNNTSSASMYKPRAGSSAFPSAARDATAALNRPPTWSGSTTCASVFGNTTVSSPAMAATTTAPSTLVFPVLSNTLTTPVQQAAEDMMLLQASAPAQANEAVRDQLAREIMHIQKRLQQQEYSLQNMQGEVANLSKRVEQIGISLGMQTTEAPATDSSLEAVSAPMSSSAPSVSSSTATAYVAPQTLGEMPQSYGFNNLVSQSIFLADGTERKYFTLPADYPLELATPQPMSNSALEKIGVTAMPSIAAQAADLAPVLCSNANNTNGSELPVPNLQQRLNVQDVSFVFTETPVYDIYEEEDSSCLNIISDVRDFSLELLQQNVERACNCPVLKASDSLVTGSSQLSVDHSTSESRLLWDPGDTKLSVLFTTAAGATKLQCIDVYNHKMVHVLPVKFGSTPYQQSYAEEQQDSEQLPMCFSKALETNQTSACWYYITDELDYALEQQQHDEKASGNVQQPRAPALNVLVLPERRKEWDPGDNCFGQRVDLKQFWAQLLLQSHSWYNTLTAFLQVHYCCLPIVLDCPYSEIVQQLVCYSRMFSLTEAIFSAMCKSTGTAVRMIVVLSSGKIAQEGRDAAVVYHIFEIQLPITKTSLIWDPGIESLLFSCKRLNIPALIQIKGWTSMTCSGISSSEYPYTMVFLHHQWEFLHQQVIQKKYNANNLLSSHYYLQL